MKIILVITFLYVVLRMWYWGETFTKGNWVGFFFFSAVNYFGYNFLMRYLEKGHPRTSYGLLEEFLWVHWFIMFTTIFSDYFWFLYLSIPIYICYRWGGMVLKYVFIVIKNVIHWILFSLLFFLNYMAHCVYINVFFSIGTSSLTV